MEEGGGRRVRRRCEGELERCPIAGFLDGGRESRARSGGGLETLGKTRKWIYPRDSEEKAAMPTL